MTQIHLEQRDWIMAGLGDENTLPHFCFQDTTQHLWGFEGITDDECGALPSHIRNAVLPYRVQDGYDRDQQPATVPVIRLENEKLRCLFYPTIGGRLASIVHKANERELLFDNPVCQPANLAIRNAWISGHVEWNGPMYGHNAHSIVPVFCARLKTDRGPLLRIFEFDRTLEIAWQVDVLLPDGDDRLWVHTTLRNTTDLRREVFWWTNIGVTVDEDTRFMTGAGSGVSHTIDHHLHRLDFPRFDDFDGSYPGRYPESRSVFMDMPQNQWPWMARLSGDGTGLAHLSTPEFAGRKLFTWGSSPGARRWLDFLSRPGAGDYLEIQAGLTANQFEVYPIEARGELHWTECFAQLQLDAAVAHAPDYAQACEAARTQLFADTPQAELARMDRFLRGLADQPIDKVLSRGACWGHVQERLRGPISPALDFTCDISDEARPWWELIDTGTFTSALEELTPPSWQISESWQAALSSSAREHGETWLHHLHLAVAQLASLDVAEAAPGSLATARPDTEAESAVANPAHRHLEASMALQPNPVASRCLALLAEHGGQVETAASHYETAWNLSKANPHLAVEIVQFLTHHGRDDQLQVFLADLPEPVQRRERIQLALAWQALERGDTDRVAAILEQPFVTIREGETTLSDLWWGMHIEIARQAAGAALTEAEQQQVRGDHPVPDRLNFMVRSDRSYLSG